MFGTVWKTNCFFSAPLLIIWITAADTKDLAAALKSVSRKEEKDGVEAFKPPHPKEW